MTEAPADSSEYAVYSSRPTSRWSSVSFAVRSFFEIFRRYSSRYWENGSDVLANP